VEACQKSRPLTGLDWVLTEVSREAIHVSYNDITPTGNVKFP